MNDFKYSELEEKANPSNVCGGMHCCRDRTCDKTKKDCKECIKDSEDAIAELNKGFPIL